MEGFQELKKDVSENKDAYRFYYENEKALEAFCRLKLVPNHPECVMEAMHVRLEDYVKHIASPDPWNVTEYMHEREKQAASDTYLAPPAYIPFVQPSEEVLSKTVWFVNKMPGVSVMRGNVSVPCFSVFFYRTALLPKEEWDVLTLYFPTHPDVKGKPSDYPIEEVAANFYVVPMMIDRLTRALVKKSDGEWIPGTSFGMSTAYLSAGFVFQDSTKVLEELTSESRLIFADAVKQGEETHAECVMREIQHRIEKFDQVVAENKEEMRAKMKYMIDHL